eukprot:scaffold447901_cov15-Prasinocladus_malaysianus.AAC.1
MADKRGMHGAKRLLPYSIFFARSFQLCRLKVCPKPSSMPVDFLFANLMVNKIVNLNTFLLAIMLEAPDQIGISKPMRKYTPKDTPVWYESLVTVPTGRPRQRMYRVNQADPDRVHSTQQEKIPKVLCAQVIGNEKIDHRIHFQAFLCPYAPANYARRAILNQQTFLEKCTAQTNQNLTMISCHKQ